MLKYNVRKFDVLVKRGEVIHEYFHPIHRRDCFT